MLSVADKNTNIFHLLPNLQVPIHRSLLCKQSSRELRGMSWLRLSSLLTLLLHSLLHGCCSHKHKDSHPNEPPREVVVIAGNFSLKGGFANMAMYDIKDGM